MNSGTRKIKSDHGGTRSEEGCGRAQSFLERRTVGTVTTKEKIRKNGSGRLALGGRRATPKKWEGGKLNNPKDILKSHRELYFMFT